MAPRYTRSDRYDRSEAQGGEAQPRPLKSRRLVEVMEGDRRKPTRPPAHSPGVSSPMAEESPKTRAFPAPARPSEGCLSSDLPEEAPEGYLPPEEPPAGYLPPEPAEEYPQPDRYPEFPEEPPEGYLPPEEPPAGYLPPEPAEEYPQPDRYPAFPEEPPQGFSPSERTEEPPDTFAVLSVHPEGEGETVAVILSVPAREIERIMAGKDTPKGTKPQKIKLRLLVEQYAQLLPRPGWITSEAVDALVEAANLCGAIRRGMALLGYGDQSARRLAYKLTAKGIDRDTAARAAAYLTEKGYIREDSTAILRAEQGLRKLWGPRRIREDLCAQGFTHEAVEEAMDSLAETDWTETCAEALRKRYGEIPGDKGARQKLIAALMRLGYDAETVREAMRRILHKS